MNKKESIDITGMSCASCALKVEKALNKFSGVSKANVNFALEKAVIEYSNTSLKREDFEKEIKGLGYGVIEKKKKQNNPGNSDFFLTGMSCANCALKIEKGLKEVKGVRSVVVNFASERATVNFDPVQVDTSKIVQVIKDLGYGGGIINEDSVDTEKEERQKEIKKLKKLFIITSLLSAPLVLGMLLAVLPVTASFIQKI